MMHIGKPEWQPILDYLADLHKKSTYPAESPLKHPFETLGTGYIGGKCFAHWDTVHVALDAFASGNIGHGRHQLLNLFTLQQADGFMPGLIYFRDQVTWNTDCGWPPVWPAAVDDYLECKDDKELLKTAFRALNRQIAWFEQKRAASPAGFYYQDILNRNWESGVDEGVRFDSVQTGPRACIDATAHVWALYDAAQRWLKKLGEDSRNFADKKDKLTNYIREELFDPQTGWFYDSWVMAGDSPKTGAFEGVWPVVVGAATKQQSIRVIEEHLMNPRRFYAAHPIPTVALDDPASEPRMWRGPAWNSMTYWAARGCLNYDQPEAACKLIEAALDDSAAQFARTETIWEFYDPCGGPPEKLQRKPDTPHNIPCHDYTGHNPLHAMAELWKQSKKRINIRT